MKLQISITNWGIGLMLMALSLTGCGGHKVLKEAEPMLSVPILASANNGDLQADLDWVIYRDGPGTWVRNADWDQYLVTLTNHTNGPLEVRNTTVYNSLGIATSAQSNRTLLIKGSKETARNYKDEGLKVKAGFGGTSLIVAGTTTGVAAVGLGAASIYGGTAVAATALTGMLIAPALVVGGIVKSSNGRKVARQIESTHASNPTSLAPGETRQLSYYFPISPSPRRVEIDYRSNAVDHVLALDTSVALQDLHIGEKTTESAANNAGR